MMAVLLVTYPRDKDYAVWCRSLVERRLAACINLVGVNSVYRWDDSVVEDSEVLLLIKTSEEKVQQLKETIALEHPYKIPEIVELKPADVNQPYLQWVLDSTQS
ncbi:MAG: divalent-cation tolerance protein CutA [Candidatus Caldarchaeum sp.]